MKRARGSRRIFTHATRRLLIRACVKPIRAPLPRIANHVVQAIPIGGKAFHRRGARKTIFIGVEIWKMSLPNVGHALSVRHKVVTPRVTFLLQPTARGKLPLGLGGQSLAGPLRIRARIAPRNLHHRMIPTSIQITRRTFRMLPIRAGNPLPPRACVVAAHWLICRREYQRARDQLLLRWFGCASRKLQLQLLPIRNLLGLRYKMRRINKPLELLVGDLGHIHHERGHFHAVSGALGFIRLRIIRAHDKLATRNMNHVR